MPHHPHLHAPLHAIVDVEAAVRHGRSPLGVASAFLAGGARLLQIRAKQMPPGAFLELIDQVLAAARPLGATVIVNDRVDLALLSGADGVHVGQDDLPVAAARRLLGNDAIVGFSTHTPEQIEHAVSDPASYLAVGPVFGTVTKATGYHPVGLERVAYAAARAGGRPVVAIGGITLDTAPSVIAAGATSVAIISDLLEAGDPAARVAAYLERLRRA